MVTRADKIGRTRIELAGILSDHFGVHVAPALLTPNYADFRGGRAYGWAYSWFYNDNKRDHPLGGVGSGHTMKDFVRLYKKGYKIVLSNEELFLDPAKEG